MATTKTSQKTKRNDKYRVIPNLTPKGKDIMIRLKNRSLITSDGGTYTLDDNLVKASRMSKKDLLNESMNNQKKIKEIETTLEKAIHEKQSINKQSKDNA